MLIFQITMEISVQMTDLPALVPSKQERDESVKVDSINESGIFSENSSSFDKPSWEVLEGEVVDYNIFDPPILCSSNVWGDPLIQCDWSSIFELTPPIKSECFIREIHYHIDICVSDEYCESTHIDASKKMVDDGESNSKGNEGRSCFYKMKMDDAVGDEYLKNEYENSFGSDLSLSGIESFDKEPGSNFPLSLNPQFELQIQLQVRISRVIST